MIGILIALLASATVQSAKPPVPAPAQPKICGYTVERSFPHDADAFTQGLIYRDGALIESTGLVGQSTIRRVRIEDGQVLQRIDIPAGLFGEGITDWKSELVSITWQNGKGFRWDAKSLRRKGEFAYPGEGWGITQDGRALILSDGTADLRFLDPATMRETRRIEVTVQGRPVRNLNELEYVDGAILANVWHSDYVLRIDPATGAVGTVINLAGLREQAGAEGSEAVLNGIAYDKAGKRLFVTGKNWPKLFEIKLTGC
ncbi:glutamine cyclotransferase [Sphingomonas zeicaulis]|uniref:glutaminyl-peptide cyclotransferase n=1 Tax=Sphingomonas zeicaulis TaxID=1632740 RepID=UPI003D1BC6A8